MWCETCEYSEFCHAAYSSVSCGVIKSRLKGHTVNSLKEFCDIAIKSQRGYEKCCRWCCEDYVSQKFDDEYCSKKCKTAQQSYRRRHEKKHRIRRIRCVNCGEPLVFGEKFCSQSCRAEYERKKRSKKNVK